MLSTTGPGKHISSQHGDLEPIPAIKFAVLTQVKILAQFNLKFMLYAQNDSEKMKSWKVCC